MLLDKCLGKQFSLLREQRLQLHQKINLFWRSFKGCRPQVGNSSFPASGTMKLGGDTQLSPPRLETATISQEIK